MKPAVVYSRVILVLIIYLFNDAMATHKQLLVCLDVVLVDVLQNKTKEREMKPAVVYSRVILVFI